MPECSRQPERSGPLRRVLRFAGIALQRDLDAALADSRRVQSELREAQAHFRRAFEDAPIGMALLALDGRFLDVNAALSAMSGFSREDLLATSVTELTHPDDRDEVTAQLQAMSDGEAVHVVADGRLTHISGGEVSVSVHATLLRNAGARPDHVLLQVQAVSEHRAFEDQLTFLADHDHLTSLYNRRRFEQEVGRHLAHCRRYGAGGALALIDIDEFKQVNDTFGHAVGDGLIVTIAEILDRRLRESDVVARLGGDEFAVLLPTVDRDEAEAAMGAVLDQIRREAWAGEGARRQPITVSVGLTMFPDTRGSSLEAVLAAADAALHEAKQAGRDRVETFD